MARPIISGDSAAVRDAFSHGENIYLVPRDDPPALAQAIRTLSADPALREKLAAGARARFCEGNSVAALGKQTEAILRRLLVKWESGS
jgi:glycosyltransferase involved in cell wall biosynthesis